MDEIEKLSLIFKTCSEPTLLNNLPKDIACEIISLVRQATIIEMEKKTIKISNVDVPEKKLIEFIRTKLDSIKCCSGCQVIDMNDHHILTSPCHECNNNEVLCRKCFQKSACSVLCNLCYSRTCAYHFKNKNCVYCGKGFKICSPCERKKESAYALCETCDFKNGNKK